MLRQQTHEAPKRRLEQVVAQANKQTPPVISKKQQPLNIPVRKQQEAANERRRSDAGLNPDGSSKPLTKLAENKTFNKFADNLALPIIGAVAGEGAGKLLGRGLSLLTKQPGSFLYHYTSKEGAESIMRTGFTVTENRPFVYATNQGNLSPLQAHIELALPSDGVIRNGIIQIDLQALKKMGIQPIIERRVTGNLPGLGAGGGRETIFNQNIPASALKKL